MEPKNIPKWQREIEVMLRDRYQGDELSELLEKASELIELTQAVGIPSGDTGQLVGQMLKMASQELRPLAATYAAFQLGVAYERYQNADRA